MLSDRNDLFRLSVAQYQRLLELKILEATCQVELLEGILIENMPRQPDDNPAARRFEESVSNALPARWELVRSRVLPLARSKPESAPQPDYVIRRAPSADGTNAQPSTEMGVVVEIAGAYPALERVDLGRIYARAEIPTYWVLDYPARVIEVFTQPSGPIDSPHYSKRDRYPVGTNVPLVLDGGTVGTVAIADVLG